MRFFYQLLAVVVLTLLAVLGWDLSQRHTLDGSKQHIIYAGMFGPGEPMQLLYSGPPARLEPEHPFGADAAGHYAALLAARPELAEAVRGNYRAAFGTALAAGEPADAGLVGRYRDLDQGYVGQLVAALGQRDRSNRLKLFAAFAQAHPQHNTRLIPTFQELHPAYRVGLFEDFERRHPQYEIIERWDGRWVLSANRPRFLTGTDVPDLIAGNLLELRILYQENLALPLDQPIPGAANPVWREKGILYEAAYGDPQTPLHETFQPWALEASRYTVGQRDVSRNHHPYPAGTRIVYLWPNMVHSSVVFYNRAHFRRIGRDGDAVPRTIGEFEEVCGQLLAAGIEPIAQDGMTYLEMWWGDAVSRTIGYDTYRRTCGGELPRFAGAGADPRYLQIARRLRGWRDADFWMKGFSGNKWPGAQRDFGAGKCTFLFTGTWLPAEISRTRSYDPEVFDLSCFVFPADPDGTGNPRQIGATAQGHAIPRQGRNPEGAALLLAFLSAHGAEMQARELNYISANKGIPFPKDVQALEPILDDAQPGDIITEGIQGDLPLFFKFVLLETFSKFFVIRSDNLTPEQFVEELERRAQAHYQRYGKGT